MKKITLLILSLLLVSSVWAVTEPGEPTVNEATASFNISDNINALVQITTNLTSDNDTTIDHWDGSAQTIPVQVCAFANTGPDEGSLYSYQLTVTTTSGDMHLKPMDETNKFSIPYTLSFTANGVTHPVTSGQPISSLPAATQLHCGGGYNAVLGVTIPAVSQDELVGGKYTDTIMLTIIPKV